MQDHNFEKQVHQKMGEMRILPSDAVWERVELRLHQKEKRRRWIIWLPLLLAGLSLGGYWIWNSSHKSPAKYQPALVNTERPKRSNDNSPGLPSEKKIKKVDEKIKAQQDNSRNKSTIKLTIQQENSQSKSDFKITTQQNKSKVAIAHRDSIATDKKPFSKTLPLITSVPESTLIKNDEPPVINTKADSSTQEHSARELFPVAVKEYPYPASTANTSLLVVKDDIHTNTISRLKHPSRGWQWGLSFQAGRSSISNSTLNKLFGGTQMDYFSSAALALPNNSVSAPGLAYKEASPLKPGAGFSVGLLVKKQFARRFAISIGLNYTLYTTTNVIGAKVDSATALQSAFANSRVSYDKYYQLGSTDKYTTRYHYIELPVILQTQLTRSRKMPLYWDLGFSVSKLAGSNVLNFDNFLGVYYKDPQRLSKTQVNLLTGLPVRLLSKQKFVLQAGPEFQYGMSRVFANETNGGKHFLFFGLKANLLFGK